MASFFQKINDFNLWYIPVIAIVLIVLIGIIVGFINGAKVAAYFFLFNLLALLIGIFAGGKIYDDNIEKWVGSNEIGKTITDNKSLFKGLVLMVCIFGLVLVLNLIALIIYLFIRKNLKKRMKFLKKTGHSLIAYRLVGSGVGFLSAVPMAMSLGGLSQILSSNEKVSKSTSKFIEIASFNQIEELYKDTNSIKILGAASETLKDIGDIFSGDNLFKKPSDNWEKNQKMIKNILNSAKARSIAQDLVSKFIDDNSVEKQQLDNSKKIDDIKTNIKNLLGDHNNNQEILMSESQKNSFINIAKNAFKNEIDQNTISVIINDIVTKK